MPASGRRYISGHRGPFGEVPKTGPGTRIDQSSRRRTAGRNTAGIDTPCSRLGQVPRNARPSGLRRFLEGERGTARAILRKIHQHQLADGFIARDIHRHDWSGLTDRDAIQRGLDLLVDLYWIAPRALPAGAKGGRPTITYAVNPRGRW